MDLFAKMATYVRVVEAGTLSAAARQLRVSPAAVSRQLATLEAELGAQLVARTTRRFAVTPAGRAYYERCLRILRDVDEAQAIARPAAGPLRVSAPVTFGLASSLPMLRAFAAAHPEIRLDVRLEDRLADLVLEGVDVAIRVAAAPPLTTDIIAQPLWTFRRVLVAAPSYLRRRGTPKTPAALAKHCALVHAADGAGESWRLWPDGGDAPVRVPIAIRCASNAGHVLRELALDGAGIGLLPRFFVAAALADGALRIVLPGWGSEAVHVHALYRASQRGEPRMRALVEHLRAAYAAIAP